MCSLLFCPQVETELHKDHVVSQWQKQISEKKQVTPQMASQSRTGLHHLYTPLSRPSSPNMQQQVSEQEEKRHFENEYERTRKEALERMKQAEEKRKADEEKRMEDLRKQMDELKLREEEVSGPFLGSRFRGDRYYNLMNVLS